MPTSSGAEIIEDVMQHVDGRGRIVAERCRNDHHYTPHLLLAFAVLFAHCYPYEIEDGMHYQEDSTDKIAM